MCLVQQLPSVHSFIVVHPPHLVSEGSPSGQSKSCKLQVGLECTQGLGESHLWADSDLVVATVLLDLSPGIVQKGGTWLQL